MGRCARGAGIAGVILAVVVGCEPAKELPTDVPTTVEGPPADAIPTASEPAAKQYVEKAVKSFTTGRPELLARAKASRLVQKGTMVIAGDNSATRTIAAVWPDRYFVSNDLQLPQGQKLNVRAWLFHTRFTAMNGNQEQEYLNRAETGRGFAADGIGQHWTALLLPLTDPKAIVYDFQSITGTAPQTGQPLPINVMKLSFGDYPPFFQLTFDAKTDTLLRTEYVVREQGVDTRKQWTALEHKPHPDGLLLPSKTEVRHGTQVVELWTIEKWEFPGTIPDAEFEPPTK